MSTKMLHVRVEDDVKQDATRILQEVGLTLSEGIRLFLNRVTIEHAIPFKLDVPNANTRAAMEEGRRLARRRRARFATSEALLDALDAKRK